MKGIIKFISIVYYFIYTYTMFVTDCTESVHLIMKPFISSLFRKVKTTKIMSTVLEGIGETPLVKINRIGKSFGLKCEICK